MIRSLVFVFGISTDLFAEFLLFTAQICGICGLRCHSPRHFLARRSAPCLLCSRRHRALLPMNGAMAHQNACGTVKHGGAMRVPIFTRNAQGGAVSFANDRIELHFHLHEFRISRTACGKWSGLIANSRVPVMGFLWPGTTQEEKIYAQTCSSECDTCI